MMLLIAADAVDAGKDDCETSDWRCRGGVGGARGDDQDSDAPTGVRTVRALGGLEIARPAVIRGYFARRIESRVCARFHAAGEIGRGEWHVGQIGAGCVNVADDVVTRT